MTLDHAITQLIATTDLASQQIELLERVLKGLNAPKERELADRIPLYPSRKAKRESLCSLRWRHFLDHVDSMARDPNYDRNEVMGKLLPNFEYFFGKLRRRRRDEVPSDQLRKFFIVANILDQVDARRAWLAEQASTSI